LPRSLAEERGPLRPRLAQAPWRRHQCDRPNRCLPKAVQVAERIQPKPNAALTPLQPMDRADISQRARAFCAPFRISDGSDFRLKSIDPGDTLHLDPSDKQRAAELLQEGVTLLAELQDMLFAQDRWGLLLVFQAMDAAGKDSTIKHVMSGVNPQGCQVSSFKAPSAEDLDHDFLWRCQRHLPERGRIGIFNRSYYEETLVVRVHPELLERQKLPRKLVGAELWTQRFRDIRHFESYLSRNGIVVRKFFLHVSHQEQKRRFLKRLDQPEKNWKFSAADVRERRHWPAYMEAYEQMIQQTAAKESPWYVVPADHKWFTRLVVAAAVIDSLLSLNLHYPEVSASARQELQQARLELEDERKD
jgi:PPK2 family polyphosphate:nucleotide phosphotransferase